MGVMHLPSVISSSLERIDRIIRTLTFVANFKLVKVSLRCTCSGLIMTNMSVFEFPPSENWRRYVS